MRGTLLLLLLPLMRTRRRAQRLCVGVGGERCLRSQRQRYGHRRRGSRRRRTRRGGLSRLALPHCLSWRRAACERRRRRRIGRGGRRRSRPPMPRPRPRRPWRLPWPWGRCGPAAGRRAGPLHVQRRVRFEEGLGRKQGHRHARLHPRRRRRPCNSSSGSGTSGTSCANSCHPDASIGKRRGRGGGEEEARGRGN